jgi:protein-disulfide isomerase
MAITLKVPASKRDHFIGSLSAPVVLVEYGDLECPHCARAMNVVDKLMAEFRDQLCFVFRHYPLNDIHPNAIMAALAAEVAGQQGMFWKMKREIMHLQTKLSASFLVDFAKTIGLTTDQFLKNLEQDELMERIEADIKSGADSGVHRLPNFFLNGILVESPVTHVGLRDEILLLLQEEDPATESP